MASPNAAGGPNLAPFTNADPFAGADGSSNGGTSISNTDLRSIARATSNEEDISPDSVNPIPATDAGSANAEKAYPPRDDIAESEGKEDGRSSGESGSGDNVKIHDYTRRRSESEAHSDTKPSILGLVETVTHDASHAVGEKMKSAAHRLHLYDMKSSGISRVFNPTSVRMHVKIRNDGGEHGDGRTAHPSDKELALLWRSRDNRKGRNSIAVPLYPSSSNESSLQNPLKYHPRLTSGAREVARNLWRMSTTFPYWDMAFWSGWSYTVGSALFVIDGAFAWGPLAFPGGEFAGESKWGVPLCFFFGAIFYQIGAVMAYLEAVNDGSFHGSAMRRLLEGHEEDQKKMLDAKLHSFFGHLVPHHHKSRDEESAEALANTVDPAAGWKTKDNRHLRPGSIYPMDKAPAPRRGGIDLGGEEGETSTYLTWRWWPSWHALRTHHVYEIGFLACAIQLFGVTLYGVTSIVGLPGILDSLKQWQENAAYWIPQMVAAACFLIASIMFAFETQEKWWKPELKVLGWWIGAWSIAGSVGFELSAAFGPASANSGLAYESSLSSMWGSGAYLIGSFLQWYEAVNKNPVEELFDEPGAMKSWQVRL